ncbi:hypothetical protein PGTUg99_000278 [Puccinia graminis f. sp. tritici]|uniref:Uncharacterized protein n=1 Tax=Puccinia graminis f. sp. tritici TaxID=56615 RepID=A0A5B0RYW3_PUCGR|nr:hypothetical protein PGTUg99_000278 [Puccinia graminis f. sp. tritici]
MLSVYCRPLLMMGTLSLPPLLRPLSIRKPNHELCPGLTQSIVLKSCHLHTLLSRVNSPFSAAQVTPTPAPKSKLPTVPQSEADLSNNPKVPSKAKDLALPAPSAEGDEDEEEGSKEEEDGSEEEEDGSEMEEELMSEEDPNRSETDEEEEERALRSKENPCVDVSARVPRKKK